MCKALGIRITWIFIDKKFLLRFWNAENADLPSSRQASRTDTDFFCWNYCCAFGTRIKRIKRINTDFFVGICVKLLEQDPHGFLLIRNFCCAFGTRIKRIDTDFFCWDYYWGFGTLIKRTCLPAGRYYRLTRIFFVGICVAPLQHKLIKPAYSQAGFINLHRCCSL